MLGPEMQGASAFLRSTGAASWRHHDTCGNDLHVLSREEGRELCLSFPLISLFPLLFILLTSARFIFQDTNSCYVISCLKVPTGSLPYWLWDEFQTSEGLISYQAAWNICSRPSPLLCLSHVTFSREFCPVGAQAQVSVPHAAVLSSFRTDEPLSLSGSLIILTHTSLRAFLQCFKIILCLPLKALSAAFDI